MKKVWSSARFLKHHWLDDGLNPRLVILFILTFLAFGTIPALLQQKIFDFAIPSGDARALFWILGALVLATLVTLALEFLIGLFETFLTEKLDFRLKITFIRHLMRLKTPAADQLTLGDLNKLLEDLGVVVRCVKGVNLDLWRHGAGLLVFGPLMVLFSWKLALVRLLSFPLSFLISQIFAPKDQEMERGIWETGAQVGTRFQEIFLGRKTLKGFAREDEVVKDFRRRLLNLRAQNFSRQVWNRSWSGTNNLQSQAFTMAVLLVGALDILSGALSLGSFMAFQVLSSQAMGSLNGLMELFKNLWAAGNPFERLERFFHLPQDILSIGPRSRDGALPGVVFDRVGFGYDPQRPLLKDFSLWIPPGKTTVLVGPSGSGKTTLGHLALGLQEPHQGQVWLERRGQAWSPQDLRWDSGVVLQETFLFQGTLRDNLTLGRRFVKDPEIWQALATVGLQELIQALPQGLDTRVGAQGTNFSGGQKQRLALARVLLQNPGFLLLDEATSALDNQSEAELIPHLKRLAQGRTTLIIAHRLHTIQWADQIHYLDRGRILESGTHEELWARGGAYHRLVTSQEAAA